MPPQVQGPFSMPVDDLAVPTALADKQRVDHTETAAIVELLGSVEGRTALIVDDFTIYAGTLDSVETQPAKLSSKVEVVSVAKLFAEAIRRINDREDRRVKPLVVLEPRVGFPRAVLGLWSRVRHTMRVDRLEVSLRPFQEDDLVLCDRSVTEPDFSGPFEWAGFASPQEYRRRWREDGLLGASPYNLVVAAASDDAAVGWVNWRNTDRSGQGVWEIGVLIVADMRGRGAGTAAQSLLADYLFSTTTAHRIWAGTEMENVTEQRALERCGFRQEGLLRGHHFRDGRWRDSFIYGLTRPDNLTRPRP